MGNTLFDQLKKSGLIDNKSAKQAKKEKHRQVSQTKGKQPRPPAESTVGARQIQAEKMARARELNLQRKQIAEQKSNAAQIKQLIQMNRIEDRRGEIGYNFADGSKVQRVYVTAEQQEQLAGGRLAIVKLEDRYELVPAAVAEKIRLRNPACLILCNTASTKNSDAEDPYADYQVPDDLMW